MSKGTGWQRDASGRVIFYFWQDGKQHKVPRADTRHLDSELDHNVKAAREAWGRANLAAKRQVEILTHADTLALVETFCIYLETRKKDHRTIHGYRHLLTSYVLPFFVQGEQLVEPDQWPRKSVRLLEHLKATDLADRTINKCNVALRVFWKWLVEEGRATGNLLLRNAVVGQQVTPLSFAVTPEQILECSYGTAEMRLMALIGFFFSLRPQELIALRRCDFMAGANAMTTEASKVMYAAGLYGRLAVNIHRQRAPRGFKPPKVNSRGWVACFNSAAAMAIVSAIKDLPPEDLLFPNGMRWYIRLWARHGFKGLNFKDLRRASLYWLGNRTELPFIALKNHARHADPSTTALYTRRPGDEQFDEIDDLDLDA